MNTSNTSTSSVSNLDRARHEAEQALKGARDDIAKFKDEVQKDPTYAMEWQGESAMRAQAFLKESKGLLDASVLGGAVDAAAACALLEGERDRIAKQLLGGLYYASTNGPWCPRSTSAMTNIQIYCECDAKRSLHALLSTLIKILLKSS